MHCHVITGGLAPCPDYFTQEFSLEFIDLYIPHEISKGSVQSFSSCHAVTAVHLMLHGKQVMPRQAVCLCCIADPFCHHSFPQTPDGTVFGSIYMQFEVTKAADSKCQMKPTFQAF